MRARSTFAILALVLGAGCAAPQATIDPYGPGGASDPAVALAALAANLRLGPTVEDWHDLSIEASPEGRVAAYRWTVPNRSLFPIANSKDVRLTLEIAPHADNASKEGIDGYAVLLLRKAENISVLHSHVLRPALQTTQKGGQGPPSATLPASFAPFFLQVRRNDLHNGSMLDLVVAVKGRAGSNLGLAVRALDHALSANERPAPDHAAFVKSEKGRTAYKLHANATGSGFQLAYYQESNLATGAAFTARSADVRVEEKATLDQRPTGAARELTLSAERGTPRGWSISTLGHSGSAGLTSYEVAFDGRGTKFASSGSTAGSGLPFGGFLNIILLRVPNYTAFGDGEGASRSSVKLTIAEATVNQVLTYTHADLDTTLESLLGRPTTDAPASPA